MENFALIDFHSRSLIDFRKHKNFRRLIKLLISMVMEQFCKRIKN